MNSTDEINCDSGKLVILSAPSGAGKTTIMKELRSEFPQLEFSVSATSRSPRVGEKDGVDYHFFDYDSFCRHIEAGKFVEWEEVYEGVRYGTLVSELERIWAAGKCIIFDVDVKGGLRLKKLFGNQALAIFIMPPSLEELRRRLELRANDSPESIDKRIAKAETEIADAEGFDRIIINDDLSSALSEVKDFVGKFLKSDA